MLASLVTFDTLVWLVHLTGNKVMSLQSLSNQSKVLIVQRRELYELFGMETRNKYEICAPDGSNLGFVAEQGKTLFQLLMRNYLGHWRTFQLSIYDQNKQQIATVNNPFRFYFRELQVIALNGKSLGTVKKQFSIFSKKFKIETASGEIFIVASPIWKIWTFPITKNDNEVACIRKKWSGAFNEMFLDADNFEIDFNDFSINVEAKTLILAAGVFVDIQYFERRART